MFFSNFCLKLKRNIPKKFKFMISTKFCKYSSFVDKEADSTMGPITKEEKNKVGSLSKVAPEA